MGRTNIYPDEFRQQAVALVRETNRPLAQIARELGVNSSTLSNWVNADRRAAHGPPGPQALSEAEREELRRLRRENAQLKTEREILKKAAAFFVQESTR